jgi:predicted RNase H-like nuclease (RuvC/YqgF family)
MSKKTVYKSEEQAEAAKAKAVRFVDEVIGDPDRASEIEDESLDQWLEETGRRIENPAPAILALVNPRRKEMARAKSVATLEAEIESLQSENQELQDSLETTEAALDEANSRLASIYDLSSEEIAPEDFSEDSDLEDEESEDPNGEED